MRKSRFSAAEITAILREAAIGASAADIAKKHGISPATFYNWKSKYEMADPSPVKQLRAMAAELAQYKTMYAELAREVFTLKNQIQNPFYKDGKDSKDEGID